MFKIKPNNFIQCASQKADTFTFPMSKAIQFTPVQ